MIIQLQQVSKSYGIPGTDNNRIILDNLNLDIHAGQMIGIVGPSGSGKSTLLNIAGTLDNADEGKVIFDGVDVSVLNDQKISAIRNKKIGFVFQLHHLLPQLSLIENVLLPLIPAKDKTLKQTARDRAMDLLRLVGLQDKITQKPGQMSVGECQRAALVRALINEPEVLMADEPTGSLDQKSADHLGELLLQINAQKGISMLIVTHSEKLAEKMQMVYTLNDGKLTLRK